MRVFRDTLRCSKASERCSYQFQRVKYYQHQSLALERFCLPQDEPTR
jgi:hypothetical protein